jgi:hypothetical protein
VYKRQRGLGDVYKRQDMDMKDKALARLQEPFSKHPRYQAPDALLQFLKTL